MNTTDTTTTADADSARRNCVGRGRGDGGARTYRCFGLDVTASLDFPGAWPRGDVEADDPVLIASAELGSWRASPDGGWAGLCDGEPFAVHCGPGGEHRFLIAGQARLELSADQRRLTGDLRPQVTDVRWWRALLDSVLFTVGLLRGGDALHAGAIATSTGAVAIVGPSGTGKSTLLAQLLTAHGCRLLTDDILFLAAGGGGVLAHPGPPVMTVPSAAAAIPGDTLAQLGSEIWTSVPVAAEPLPLRRIVVLDRSGGPEARLLTVDDPFRMLMRHLLPFPRTGARAAARLALAAEIAGSVELVCLQAPLTCPAPRLAELALGTPGGR